jgi:hypothetical protein
MPNRTRLVLAVLFPATFALHVTEEWLGGFPSFMALVSGRTMSETVFLNVNGVYLALVVIAVAVAAIRSGFDWIYPGLATVILFNTATHLSGAAFVRAYSPGLVTALSLWIPLGTWVARSSWRRLPRPTFWGGVTAGAVTMVGVGLLALPLSRPVP